MINVNRVQLLGYVGSANSIAIRKTQSGKEVGSFSLATNSSWIDKESGEQKTTTQWHNIVVWSTGLIKVISDYLKQGTKVLVEGELQYRSWEDEEGQKHYAADIVLSGAEGSLIVLDTLDKAEAAHA